MKLNDRKIRWLIQEKLRGRGARALALQLGPYNIRVNCISPGIVAGVDPDGVRTSVDFTSQEERDLLRTIPLGRFARPKDIANVSLFLASDQSSYIHGATIDVTGGRLIRH